MTAGANAIEGPGAPARPLPRGWAGRLAGGASIALRAAALLRERRPLWKWALVPAALTLAGLALGAAAAVPLSARLLALAWAEPAGWSAALWWLARAALFLLLVYVAAVGLPLVASGPFMDALSVRVEEAELGAAPAATGGLGRAAAEAATGALHAVRRLAVLAAGYAVLLPTMLVPFAWPVLAFLWTARWTAVEWLELAMARHLHRPSEVRAALRAARPYGFGMGGALAALFVLPLANLLVVPVGAIAGTLLYCDLVRAGIVERR